MEADSLFYNTTSHTVRLYYFVSPSCNCSWPNLWHKFNWKERKNEQTKGTICRQRLAVHVVVLDQIFHTNLTGKKERMHKQRERYAGRGWCSLLQGTTRIYRHFGPKPSRSLDTSAPNHLGPSHFGPSHLGPSYLCPTDTSAPSHLGPSHISVPVLFRIFCVYLFNILWGASFRRMTEHYTLFFIMSPCMQVIYFLYRRNKRLQSTI